MKSSTKFFLKILVFLSLLIGSYYLFILRPRLELPDKLLRAEKVLSLHYSILLQNRLSLVELTRLDPDSGNFNLEKSNLVANIQQTNKEGLEFIGKETEITDIDNALTKRFPEILEESQIIYQNQNKLLEKVFSTDSYESGVETIKSDQSIDLLTRHTNLILEYEFWLSLINDKQEELIYQTTN